MSDKKELTPEQEELINRMKPLFLAMIKELTIDIEGNTTEVTFIQRFTKYYIMAGEVFNPTHYDNKLYMPKTWENPFGETGLSQHEFFQMNHLYGMLIGFKCGFDQSEFVDKLIQECILLQLMAQRKAEGLDNPSNLIIT